MVPLQRSVSVKGNRCGLDLELWTLQVGWEFPFLSNSLYSLWPIPRPNVFIGVFHLYVYMCTLCVPGDWSQSVRTPGTDITNGCEPPCMMLGTKPGFSARAVLAVDYWVVSIAFSSPFTCRPYSAYLERWTVHFISFVFMKWVSWDEGGSLEEDFWTFEKGFS